MAHDFDTPIERQDTDCVKWSVYERDVIPMWVADMDFSAPAPVLEALHQRIDHGVFGYQMDCPSLREVLVDRLQTRHGIQATSEELLFTPGIVSALNIVCRTFGEPGDGVLVNTPIYPPFLSAPRVGDKVVQTAPLAETHDGSCLRYEIDFDALEAAVTPRTKIFLFCNPHNPVGRVYTRMELERIADFVLRHDLILCSDEIHCDLLHPGSRHISIASLSPEIAERTITLSAPSKTFNIPGLGLGFAVIENPEFMRKLRSAIYENAAFVNTLAYTAAEAAYRDGQAWLDALLVYLTENRDLLVDFMREHLPQIPLTKPEGTYLAWLDCRALNTEESPYRFFLNHARIAFNDGASFGEDGKGFVRLNYGCTRSTLVDALDRMREAVQAVS